jgi:hypothetical protein
MAELTIEGEDLVVRLSSLERLGAFRGDVRVPLSTVREVRVSAEPWAELRGLRAPGTGIPGVISLCTRRGRGFRDFAAVYRRQPAVVVECSGAPFDRLVISCADAEAKARMLEERLSSATSG